MNNQMYLYLWEVSICSWTLTPIIQNQSSIEVCISVTSPHCWILVYFLCHFAVFLHFKPVFSIAKGSRGREGWVLWRPLSPWQRGSPAKIGETHLAPGHPCISCLYFTRICNCISVLRHSATSVLSSHTLMPVRWWVSFHCDGTQVYQTFHTWAPILLSDPHSPPISSGT